MEFAFISYEFIMNVAETDPNLKKTFKGVAHQVVCTGSGAAIGGILGGPVGAVIGSLAGTAIGYWTVDDYDSMIKVLYNMKETDKQRLVSEVQNLVGSSAQDVLLKFLTTEGNQKRFLSLLQHFSKNI